MKHPWDVPFLVDYVLNVNFMVILQYNVEDCKVLRVHSTDSSGVPGFIVYQPVTLRHVTKGCQFTFDKCDISHSSIGSKKFESDVIIQFIEFTLSIRGDDYFGESVPSFWQTIRTSRRR